MNTFDITRTPISYNDSVKMILIVEGSTYQGGAFQGFIHDNQHFPLLGMPFDAVYNDKITYDVDETTDEYKFTKRELNKRTEEDLEELSWKEIEKIMLSGKLFINVRGKPRFVSAMVVHEKVYDMIMKSETDSRLYGEKTSYFSKIKKKVTKELDVLLTNELSGDSLEAFEEDLSEQENPTKEEIDKSRKNYLLAARMHINYQMKFVFDSKSFKKILDFFGNERGIDLITEISLLDKILLLNGCYFMPQTNCSEVVDANDLSKYNQKLSQLQSEIGISRFDESLPFKKEVLYVFTKIDLMKKLEEFGIEIENVEEKLENLSKKGVFSLTLDRKSSDGLISLISENFNNEESILFQLK